MPLATPAQYQAMLDAAQAGGYAYPAINITSLVTINAALKAFMLAAWVPTGTFFFVVVVNCFRFVLVPPRRA